MAIKKTIEIDVNTTDAVKGVDNLNKSIKETNKDVSNVSETSKQLGNSLDSATGGAIGKFKGLTGAVKSAVTGFKSLKIAVAATGLGLLLIALVSIKKAFTSSEEGQNKFAKILSFIGTLTGNLVDIISDLGEKIISVFENPQQAIKDFAKLIKDNIVTRFEGLISLIPSLGKAVSALFKGDFAEAGKIATNAVGKVALGVDSVTTSLQNATQATKDFIAEQERELVIAGKIADQRANAEKIERSLIVGRAEAERKIADLREKAAQKDKFNASERKQFLVEASKVNEDITNKEIEAAKLRRDAIIEENKLSKSNKDALKAEEEAKAKVIQLETARLKLQKSLSAEISAVNAQQSAENKAKLKEQEDRTNKEIEENNKRLQSIADLKKKFLDADADNDAKTREQKLELERSRAEQDLENLIGTETEKREAKIALDAFYDQREAELKAERDAEAFDKDNAERAKDFDTKQKEKVKRAKEELEVEKFLNKAKSSIRDANTKSISDGINLIKGLFEKNKAIQAGVIVADNAVGIAKTVIATQASNAATTAEGAALAIPSGGASVAAAAALVSSNNISAGISIATSVAATAKALGQLGKGGGSASGGSASGGSAPTTPPAFNLVGGSNVNEIGDTLNQEQTPIQAYVVGSEVTNQQEIDNAQASSASIG